MQRSNADSQNSFPLDLSADTPIDMSLQSLPIELVETSQLEEHSTVMVTLGFYQR